MTAAQTIKLWRDDPVRFVHENFGVVPDAWQQEALRAFARPDLQRISLQACVGPGKTAVLAWCIWNFLLCHADEEDKPAGAAVAITDANLKANLWKELAHWQGKSPLLSGMFEWNQAKIQAYPHTCENPKKAATWKFEARSWPKSASPNEQGATLSGLHGKYVMAVVDESGAIPETVLQACDQALSNCTFGKIMQAGNPISLQGMLYAAATRLRSLWHVIRVTGDPDDPQRSPRISIEWAKNQINLYGRDNPWVKSQILGEFPPSSLNTLLSPEDVMEAMRRSYRTGEYWWAQPRIGVDVARFGDDRTVLFVRQGTQAMTPRVMRHIRDSAVSTDIATAVLKLQLDWPRSIALIDATGGWAAGARDVLVASNVPPISIQFHGQSDDPRYKNNRAAMWFRMAEWIKSGGALPNEPDLVAELTEPTYTFVNGKFQLEPKEQVKERLGRSPDLADALALTFGLPDVPIDLQPTGSEPRYRPPSIWS